MTIKHTCFFIVVLFLETERACVHVMSIAKQQTEQVNVEMYGKRKPKKCTYHSGDVCVSVYGVRLQCHESGEQFHFENSMKTYDTDTNIRSLFYI